MGLSLAGLLVLSVARPIRCSSSRRRWSGSARPSSTRSPRGWRDGLRRPARLRAVALPGGRQHRLGARAAACRVRRGAPRPAERRWFSLRRSSAMIVLSRVGALVQARTGGAPPGPGARTPAARPAPRQGGGRAHDPAGPGVHQVRLSREHQQLLHLLPDREVRPLGAERAAAPLRVPRGGGRGHDHRRPGRRPARAQVGDLGEHPRRAAVHPRAPVREPVLDRRAQRGRSG